MTVETKRPAHRGPYAKSAAVREQILAAATDIFAESGFRGATIAKVAERAGVSERGLAHHFSGKEALLLGVLDRHEHRSDEKVSAATGLASLRAVLRIVEEDDRDSSALVELHCVLSAEATAADHPAHERYAARYGGLRQYLAAAFVGLRDRGWVRSGLQPEELAAGVVALLDGLQLQWVYDRGAFNVVRVVYGFLDGILSEEAMAELRGLRG